MKKLLLSIPLLFVGCQTEKLHFIEGEAQGSTYHIKYISSSNENLQPAIDSILQVIDQSMSTYKPDSDISKINAGDTTVALSTSLWEARPVMGLMECTYLRPLLSVHTLR